MYALEIKNLTKIYANKFTALKSINLKVQAGDFFALLGPNGAGKTTTIGILSSLVTLTDGCVKVFGHDLQNDNYLVKQSIGLVPQEFNFNIFEKIINVVLNQAGYYGVPRSLAKQRAEKYLKQLGLWDKRFNTPRELSGGMKRRLMIARALVHEPKLLILDEPTAGVDIELRRSMWDFLRAINQAGTTVILTTHYLEEAENLCKNIAIINNGQIIEHTKMDELLRRLKSETFILYLQQPLWELPNLKPFSCKLIDSHTIEVEIKSGQSINHLYAQLSNAQISVNSMRNKVNRLEEMFMNLIAAE